MPGIHLSTGSATFVLPYPLRTSTTGAAAALSYTTSFGTANSGFTFVITRPSGADITFTGNSPPAGVTLSFAGQQPVGQWVVTLASTLYTTAGIYTCTVIVTADLSYRGSADTFQWGGWVDTVNTGATSSTTAAAQATIAATQATTAATQSTTAATQATTAATQSTTAAAQATIAATQATLGRKYSGNKIGVDSTTEPAVLTYYQDDGVTALGSRTIANADGSPVSPKQVLILGAVT